jgi:hypothetical protein
MVQWRNGCFRRTNTHWCSVSGHLKLLLDERQSLLENAWELCYAPFPDHSWLLLNRCLKYPTASQQQWRNLWLMAGLYAAQGALVGSAQWKVILISRNTERDRAMGVWHSQCASTFEQPT